MARSVSRARCSASSALLRRTGTVPNTGVRYGPGSAAHRFASATRCAASGARNHPISPSRKIDIVWVPCGSPVAKIRIWISLMKFAGSDFTRCVRMVLGTVAMALAVMLAAALPAAAQTPAAPAAAPAAVQPGPSAAGLWQKTEDGKPDGWFLVVDRDGSIFEGAIAKMFLNPAKTRTSSAPNAPTTARTSPGSDCPSSAT